MSNAIIDNVSVDVSTWSCHPFLIAAPINTLPYLEAFFRLDVVVMPIGSLINLLLLDVPLPETMFIDSYS
jgi:hypothetical protein